MSNETGDWEIYIADVDGSNPQNVSNNEGFDAFPNWSPQAQRLTWISDRYGDGMEVLIADIEGNKLANVSNQVETDDFSQLWSPNGQFLAYVSTRFGDGEVFVSLLDGTTYNLSDSEANDLLFDWSPACAELIAGDDWGSCRLLIGSDRIRDREGGATQLTLFSVSADGQNFDLVLDVDLKVSEAAFSPDGTTIAYLKEDTRNETVDLYLLDLATQEETRLTEDEIIKQNIAWSPTGELIGYVGQLDGDPNDIYTVSVPDGDVTRLTEPNVRDALNSDFAWSPDGTQMLFSSLRDGNPDIFVMDTDGDNATNLTKSDAAELEGFWIE
jgi:Tol biopolymer transport system component